MTTAGSALPARIPAGSPALRRLQVAMVSAGLAALALLYDTQALLPQIGDAFGVGAATASLTVAVTTGALALTVLPISGAAERHGRPRVMTAGLAVATVFVLLGAAAPTFWLLLVTRAVVGLALAAVVAVAMGHIGDEVDGPAAVGAIGVYVSGTTVGGLIGRLVPAGVSDFGGWRWSIVVLGLVAGVCAVVFAVLVPPAHAIESAQRSRAIADHLRDPGTLRLCTVALLLMGGFVATYNYLTYRLTDPPFGLSPSVVGLVFLAYLAGTVSSTLAGRRAARAGRLPVLLGSVTLALVGLGITLVDSLVPVLIGLVLFTAGFFGAHTVASAWITVRAAHHRGHASALYLMAYYLGSSVGGSAIGLAWTAGGWGATVACVAGCFVLAAVAASGVRDQPARTS